MILVVLYIDTNCAVDKTKGTETSNIHCDYITCCIIIITLTIIVWYYLLAHVANLSKHTHLERYVTGNCATWARLFLPNAHPHNWFMPATAQIKNVYYYKQFGFHLEIQKTIYWKISKRCRYHSN